MQRFQKWLNDDKKKRREEEEEEEDDYDDDSLCTDVSPPSEKIGREGETSVHRLSS